ncbi:MAG: hypothetical protein ABIJ85_00115 [bacterium]
MPDWNLEPNTKYIGNHKNFEKKSPNELKSMESNLDKYFAALNEVDNPLQVKAGFIHDEPDGIKAIDQKGGGQKVKLRQTRLYVFPHIETKTLYLLAIGDKNNQKDDIKRCRDFVRMIKKGGTNDQKV